MNHYYELLLVLPHFITPFLVYCFYTHTTFIECAYKGVQVNALMQMFSCLYLRKTVHESLMSRKGDVYLCHKHNMAHHCLAELFAFLRLVCVHFNSHEQKPPRGFLL